MVLLPITPEEKETAPNVLTIGSYEDDGSISKTYYKTMIELSPDNHIMPSDEIAALVLNSVLKTINENK